MNRTRSVARWSIVALLFIALLIVGVSMIDTRIWFLELPAQFRWHAFLFFAVASVLSVAIYVRRRAARRAWAVPALALVGVVMCGWSVARTALENRADLGANAVQLSAIQFNLGERDGDWQDVLAWLHAQHADVIFLQEARPAFEKELEASPLASKVVFRNVRPDSRGTVALVFDGVTLNDARLDVDTFAKTGREMITLDVEKGGVRRALLSMHMCRPTNAIEFAKQSYEIEQLGHWFERNPTGIAIGDINCTAYSPRLTKVLARDHLQASRVGTWPTPLPSWFDIGIDELIVGHNTVIESASAGPNLASDHRPLVAKMRVD